MLTIIVQLINFYMFGLWAIIGKLVLEFIFGKYRRLFTDVRINM
jgi:hypothetical protein